MWLTMSGWDIDTYIITTFEWLALAAGWTLDAEGTIVWFCEGLSKGIHSKALDCNKIPCTITEWKVVARMKVARVKEKYSTGLTGAQWHNQQKPCDLGNYQNNQNQCMEESLCEFEVEEFLQGEGGREMRQITSEIRGREKGLKGNGNDPKARWHTSQGQQLGRLNGGGDGGSRQWTWWVEVLMRWDAKVRGTQA